MAKCLNCDNEAVGRSRYCSDSCKVLYNRKQQKGKSVNNTKRKQQTVTPEGLVDAVPVNYGQPDCACKHCQQNIIAGNRLIINHGKYKPYYQLARNEINRVSLPGDIDYTGVGLLGATVLDIDPTETADSVLTARGLR